MNTHESLADKLNKDIQQESSDLDSLVTSKSS